MTIFFNEKKHTETSTLGTKNIMNTATPDKARFLRAFSIATLFLAGAALHAATVTENTGKWDAVTWTGDDYDYAIHKTGNVTLDTGDKTVTSLSMTSGGQLHVTGGTITSSGVLTVGGWGTSGYNANGTLNIGSGGEVTINSGGGSTFSSIGFSGGTSIANITSGGTLTTNAIRIGNGNSSTGSLGVNTGGNFTFRGELGIGIGATGTVTVNGGTVTGASNQNVTVGGATGGVNGTGTLKIIAGSLSTAGTGTVRVGLASGTAGILDMEGGTLTASALSFGASGGTGSLKMDASASIRVSGTISVNSGTNWDLDVSSLTFGGASGIEAGSLTGSGATITVNLTNFATDFMGTKYINLLTLGTAPDQSVKDSLVFSFLKDAPSLGDYIDVSQLNTGSFVWIGNTLALEVTGVAVPEPSTCAAILGVLALVASALLRRR